MDFVDVDYTDVPDEPVTDTWYTCPACGCLNHSGCPCDCGYDPRRTVTAKKHRRCRPSAAVIIRSIALLASLAISVAREISYSECRAALLDAQESNANARISISNLSSTIRSLRDELDDLSLYANNACVVPTNGRMYHRDPTCSKCDLLDGYWIYNTELSANKGYKACPSCSIVEMPVLGN